MEKIQFTEILQSASKITRKRKLLWLFGLFIFIASLNPFFEKTSDIKKIILIFFLYLPFYFFKLFSVAALIKSGNDINLYSQLIFKQILASTKKYILNLFVIDFSLTCVLLSFIAIIMFPAAYLIKQNYSFISITFFLLAGLLIFLVAILIYFLRKYAFLYTVIANLNPKQALIAAYDLYEKKINQSLVMAFLLISLRFILLIIIAVILLIAFLPIVLFTLLGYIVLAKVATFWIIFFIAVLLLIPVVILLSIFEAFSQIAWTLFFQQISFDKNKEIKNEEIEIDAMPNPEAA